MGTKPLIWIGLTVGGTLGGLVPSLFGANPLGLAGVIGSTIGGLLGIWAGFKIGSE